MFISTLDDCRIYYYFIIELDYSNTYDDCSCAWVLG